MKNSNIFRSNKNDQIELNKLISEYLLIPERINSKNKDLTFVLINFLIEKGYINGVEIWKDSWGCKYEGNTIYINDLEIPDSAYDYYIFHLGTSAQGESLAPRKNETTRYRFLHEVGHAYQDFLVNKESNGNSNEWYNEAILNNNGKSYYQLLLKFCFKKRSENKGLGLSTWGNVPDYSNIKNINSQILIRSVEDANELLVMYLWNEEYFNTFLKYISGNIPGCNKYIINNDGLAMISQDEIKDIRFLITGMYKEMVDNISFFYDVIRGVKDRTKNIF